MRDPAATAFERQFLAWLHIHLGVEPTERAGTNAFWWTFPFKKTDVNFVIVGQKMNSAAPPAAANDWLLRIDEDEDVGFVALVAPYFAPGAGVRRRFSSGRVRVQFKSGDLIRQFEDQRIGTGVPHDRSMPRAADPAPPSPLNADLQAVMERQFTPLVARHTDGILNPFVAFMNDQGDIYGGDDQDAHGDAEAAINRLSFRLRAALSDHKITVGALFFHARREGDQLFALNSINDEPSAIVGYFETRGGESVQMVWPYERSDDAQEAPNGWKYADPELWRASGLPVLWRPDVRWLAPPVVRGAIARCAIDAAGLHGLVVLSDGSAMICDLETMERSGRLAPPELKGSAHAIDAGRIRMLQGESRGELTLHSFASGQSSSLFRSLSGGISACALSADGRFALAGTAGGDLIYCDLEFRLAKTLAMKDPQPISACACSPDGSAAITICADGYTALWRFVHGVAVTIADRASSLDDARIAAVSANGRYAVLAGGRLFVVWNVELNTPGALTDAGAEIEACAISPNGQFLLLGLRSGAIRLFDVHLGEARNEVGATDRATAIAFTPDGGSALIGHASGAVRLMRLLPV